MVRAIRLAVKAVVIDVVAVAIVLVLAIAIVAPKQGGAQAGHRTRVRGPMAVPNLRQHRR